MLHAAGCVQGPAGQQADLWVTAHAWHGAGPCALVLDVVCRTHRQVTHNISPCLFLCPRRPPSQLSLYFHRICTAPALAPALSSPARIDTR